MCAIIKGFLSLILKLANIAFLICGIAILIAGALTKIKASGLFSSYLSGPILSSPVILIVTGIIIIVISFLGCCGFKRRSLICLVPYAVCLVVVIIVGLVVIILMTTHYKGYKKELNSSLSKSFKEYHTSSDAKKFWDEMQADVMCCGLEGSKDWKGDVPESCCNEKESKATRKSRECKTAKKPYLHVYGCVDAIVKFVNKYWNIIMGTTIILTVFSTLALALSIIVICDIVCPGHGDSRGK